jgi:hypothetical protein
MVGSAGHLGFWTHAGPQIGDGVGLTNNPADEAMTLRVLVIKLLRALRLNQVAASFYYRHMHGFASAGKELPDVVQRCLAKAIELGTATKGDYYEFGVFKGHTFWQAQRRAQALGLTGMRYFGFDSFEGLPEATGPDKTEDEHFYEGQYACSLETVRRSLSEHGMEWDTAFLIKGFFSDSLNPATRRRHHMGKVAIALVDGDRYSSTKETLQFIEDMLLDGTIMIMDDWNAFDAADDRGERLALREFLAGHPQWSAEPWFAYGSYGQVFIMRAA